MAKSSDGLSHRPVLYQEIIHAIQPKSGGLYVDCTVGSGGHAWGILAGSTPEGKLLGLDQDPQALVIAQQRLAQFGERVLLRRVSYVTLLEQLASVQWPMVDGILLDLGVSSMQLDTPERGFSFRAEAPLDMRFDPLGTLRAADLVNDLPEQELADLIFRFGEEPKARLVARAIVQARPVTTTSQLAEIISRVAGRRTKRRGAEQNRSVHPATRTFQALRIAVNRELEALELVLPQAVQALAPGGRLAVIAFHSLEDRIVKQFMRRESRDCLCPPRQPICTCGHRATLREISRQVGRPNLEEVQANPRARSSRLRVAEKQT